MNKQNYIQGFKVFNQDFTTRSGIKFAVGDHKHIDGEVVAGPINGHGWQFCKNFEDTFRFVRENPILCEIIAFGEISKEYKDDYYEYDEIYACSDIYIKRVISREEIISMAKELCDWKLQRLIITYNMTDEEIEEIEQSLPPNSEKTKKYIDYYHRGNGKAFE